MEAETLRREPADAPYWQALREGRFMMQHCQGCGRWRWPACWRCGDCGTWFPAWKDTPFEGLVYSWTKVWYPFGGTEALGVPFVTVLAELPQADNQRILGVFEGDEADLAFGRAVRGHTTDLDFHGEPMISLRWRLA